MCQEKSSPMLVPTTVARSQAGAHSTILPTRLALVGHGTKHGQPHLFLRAARYRVLPQALLPAPRLPTIQPPAAVAQAVQRPRQMHPLACRIFLAQFIQPEKSSATPVAITNAIFPVGAPPAMRRMNQVWDGRGRRPGRHRLPHCAHRPRQPASQRPPQPPQR